VTSTGHWLVSDYPFCFVLIGCIKDRDTCIDTPQAWSGNNQGVVCHQLPQPGRVILEGRTFGVVHRSDEVVSVRVHEKDPLAHSLIIPQSWGTRTNGF
jgi:hypothetical protein